MPILNHAAFWGGTGSTGFWSRGDWGHASRSGNGGANAGREPEPTLRSRRRSRSPLVIGARGSRGQGPGIRRRRAGRTSGPSTRTGRGTRDATRPSSGPSVEETHVFALNTLASAVAKRVAFVDVPGLAAAHRARPVDVGIFGDEYTVELAGHDTAALRINEVRCVKRPART
ncbi:hypothetical protein LY76DRAFT_685361 [Colletotrichum caudatum]|nr:hypothetical protein LY76DRAFT_685361 [Colletotrichum caudatum]